LNLRVALQLGRVSNLPTVWSNVLAAVVLSGAPLRVSFLAGLALALSCFYVGGMYLNDAFDREIDARERPERPLPSGRATPGEVLAVGFGLLFLGVAGTAIAARLGPAPGAVVPALAAAAGLGALIVAYDLHHKTNPLGPLLMALCRGGVYVTAALAAGRLTWTVLHGAALLVAYLLGLSALAREERGAGRSVPWGLALLWVPLLVGGGWGQGWGPAVASLAFLAWTARAVSFLTAWRGGQVGPAIGALIAGISLVDARLIAGHASLGWVLVALGAAVLTLFSQRYVRGT
jgi:UbiA prenyltransferase family protein